MQYLPTMSKTIRCVAQLFMLLALTSQVTVDFFHPLEDHVCSITDSNNGHDSFHSDFDCLACSVVKGSAQPVAAISLQAAYVPCQEVVTTVPEAPHLKTDDGLIETRGPQAGWA